METRQGLARDEINMLIDRVCIVAIIYLAGGNKVEVGNVRDNIDDAQNSIADRRFTDFKSKGD